MTIYATWVKIGLEKDLKSVWTRTDHTHRIILTIWASDERQNANLVHLSEGNKVFQEQAGLRCKMKDNDGNPFESRFCNASHHFWSQKSGHYRQELSVFLRENEWFRIFTRSRSTMCLWRPVHRQKGPLLPVHTNSSGFNTTFWGQKVVQGMHLRLHRGGASQSCLRVTSVFSRGNNGFLCLTVLLATESALM